MRMTRRAPVLSGPATEARTRAAILPARLLFLTLLALAPLLPHIGNSYWTFPAVSRAWVLAPFALLFLLPLVDVRRPWRIVHLDLLALLLPLVALGAGSGVAPGR
jgi:hypothetical protein